MQMGLQLLTATGIASLDSLHLAMANIGPGTPTVKRQEVPTSRYSSGGVIVDLALTISSVISE